MDLLMLHTLYFLADRNITKFSRTNAGSFTRTEEAPATLQAGDRLVSEQLCGAGPEVKLLNTSEQCALEAMQAKHMPGCLCKRAPGSLREGDILFPLAL